MQNLIRDYGMILVLFALCVLFSLLTLEQQMPEGSQVANQIMDSVGKEKNLNESILTVGSSNKSSANLAKSLAIILEKEGFKAVQSVVGSPKDFRIALDQMQLDNEPPKIIVPSQDVQQWRLFQQLKGKYPFLKETKIVTPGTYLWPNFLKKSNLLAIVDRIVVIAVMAIGMTMVIITGGIDLSVGSLIAVSAVIGTSIMQAMGGPDASSMIVFFGFLMGTLFTGIIGAFGGLIVAYFKVPPFITTLGIMLMGRGLAFLITGGFSIYQVPSSLPWLGQGTTFAIPNTVILLVLLYVVAHIFMTYSRLGRYIYAVGGNEEAARLSGVSVGFVTTFVFLFSGLTAGLGGCIQASQLNSGTPNMGLMYELYVIAAVVVGGTSLSGGSGKILGTLIGVFVISVIQNGMNLIGLESYTQQVVLGFVILIAVLLDKARSMGTFEKIFKRNQIIKEIKK